MKTPISHIAIYILENKTVVVFWRSLDKDKRRRFTNLGALVKTRIIEICHTLVTERGWKCTPLGHSVGYIIERPGFVPDQPRQVGLELVAEIRAEFEAADSSDLVKRSELAARLRKVMKVFGESDEAKLLFKELLNLNERDQIPEPSNA